MANNEQKKTIPLSTIPTSKLTVILNNFIVNTVNHLNKLSLNVDEKLSEFDKKMNDLEVMTTLFEAKLESLPDEIKSKYPPLQQCSLDDANPVFSVNANNNVQASGRKENEQNKNEDMQNENKEKGTENGEEKKEEEKKEEVVEEQKELTPEEELRAFLDQNNDYKDLFKMLKVGVTIMQVEQKARLNGYDMDLFYEMVDKSKKAFPNIH